MRVLVFGINYAPDLIGVAKYTAELCESLAARGHSVRVVTAPPYYPDWKVPAGYRSFWYTKERLNDVDVTRAPIYVPRKPSGVKRLLHHASFLLSAAIPLLSTAMRWRPDIVFTVAPSLLSAPMAALAAKTAGAASWLHVQDLEVDVAFELGLLRNRTTRKLMLGLERMILGAFDRVSTISPQMVRRLERKGLAPDRLREFRNWVDTSVIVPGSNQTSLRTSLGLKPTDIVVLYSGAISHKQGLEQIVEVAKATKDSHPSLQFVVGGNGPLKPALVEMASGLNNVHFLDLQPVERFSELLNTADIHLLPQKAQVSDLVLPSKLAGMLASGRPVIAMANPGTGIALETAGSGLIIPPGDGQALVSAVIALAEDRALRERFGAAARFRAKRKWDRVAIISSLEREFLELPQRTAEVPTRRWSTKSTTAASSRSIEQVATGTRRRPSASAKSLTANLARQPNSSANSLYD
jgi:colanic acid biosynthesis glycosyl transferase WcaI